MSQPTLSPSDKLAYSPAEAAALLGCTRQHIYTLMARGDLPSKKLGGARRITRAAILRLLGEES